MELYKPDIEAILSEEVGTPVRIGSMRATLNGFMPELGLYQLQIAATNQKTAVRLKEIQLGIDVFKLFYKPWIESLKVNLVGAKLSITRLESGTIAISGLPSHPDNDEEPRWLMQGNQYKLIDSEIEWQDQKRHTKKLLLKHVNITINNENNRHKVAINTVLPESLGATLSLKMNFTGDIFSAKSINAKLFVHGFNINFSQLATGDLPFDFSFIRGRGDFSLWSTWQATQMADFSGSIQIRNALLQDKKQKLKKLQLDVVNLNFKLQKQEGWKLAIENSELSSYGVKLRIPKLAFALQKNAKGELFKLALNVPYLNLGHVSKIINRNSLLPKAIREPAKAFALEGVLSQLQLYTNLETNKFSVDAEVRKLSFKAHKGVPRVQNLALSLQGTETIGKISLKSEQLGVHFHGLFRTPLYFKQAIGDIFWQQKTDFWQLSSAAVQLNTQDIKTKSRLDLILPKNENPAKINLQSYFYEGRNASTVPKYLPVGIMNKQVVTWLDNAFLAGDVDQGGVLLRGELKEFPYIKYQGVFEVLFGAQKIALHYADGWQDIHNLDAKIRFFSESLAVEINKGSVNKAEIKTAKLAIDSFSKSEYLTIQGDVDAELSRAIEFLKFSPFEKDASQLDEHFVMQGDVALKLDLAIPLAEVPTKVSVDAKINNAEAVVMPSQIKIKQLNTLIHITENSVFSDDFSAQVFSFPIKGSIHSDDNNIYADLVGLVGIEQLAAYQPSDFWQYAEGETEYQVNLQIAKNSTDSSRLKISSDLKGLAINLPPFSKLSEQEHPFSTEFYMGETGLQGAHFIYDNKSSEKDKLDINFKQINSHWQGLFYSPFAKGSFFMPIEIDRQSLISFKLDRLDLSALKSLELKADKKNATQFLANKWPAIIIESEAFYYQDRNYGTFKLQTEPVDVGLLIKQTSLMGKAGQLEFSGLWSQKERDKTQITGMFKHKNLGQLLRNLKLSENLHKADAKFKFSFNWSDAPHKLSKKNISGVLSVELGEGRLLGVEPGLGRILGGLDTWKLMDRLSLDFSDIALEGLSFTEMIGDLTVNKGQVETPKLYINAMPAKIYMSGHTNLETEELALHATVLPKFPIAGTIMGNIANSVTKAFVGDEHAGGLLLSLRYDITGSWDDVKVNRLFSPFLQDKITPEVDSASGGKFDDTTKE